MRCLVVVEDEGWAVLRSLTKEMHDMNQIAGTRVYISLLPAYTSIIFSSRFKPTGSILNYLDITLLAQNNASRSKTHLITCATSSVHSGLPFATFNYIIMLTPRM